MLFTVTLVSLRFLVVWCLSRSDSGWSALVLHSAHNLFLFSFFAQLPDDQPDLYPQARFVIGEAGWIAALLYTAVAAAVLWKWLRSAHTSRPE